MSCVVVGGLLLETLSYSVKTLICKYIRGVLQVLYAKNLSRQHLRGFVAWVCLICWVTGYRFLFSKRLVLIAVLNVNTQACLLSKNKGKTQYTERWSREFNYTLILLPLVSVIL